jgi:ADP-ribose pyrophosphatase
MEETVIEPSGENLPRIASSSVLWRGPLQQIEIVQLGLSDGSTQSRIVCRQAPGVVIAAVNGNDEVLLIRSYRFILDRWLLELPAGKVEDEDYLAAAQRELLEETGYTAGQWQALGTAYGAQGSSDWLCCYFLARELQRQSQSPQADESHELLWVPMSQWSQLLDTGELCNNFTIVGLLKAARQLC